MRIADGSRRSFKEHNWNCVELSMDRVEELRTIKHYYDWFYNDDCLSRYAIFSVNNAVEFWFEDGAKATEFTLRFS